MTLKQKTILIAACPVLGVIVFFFFNGLVGTLPKESSGDLGHALNWLIAIGGLYIGNFLLAWRYRGSWPMTLGRSLLWAFFAYICISNLVDVFGINKELAMQILGETGPGDSAFVAGLRGAVIVWGTALAMCVVCIAVGFEKESSDSENP